MSGPRPADGEAGQVIVESAIVLPLFIMLILGITQLALIFVARSMIDYASFAAARAELVGKDPVTAARTVLSVVSGPTMLAPAAGSLVMPGWGNLPRYASAAEKTRVDVLVPLADSGDRVSVQVSHDFELILPEIALPFLGISGKSFQSASAGKASFLTLSDTTTLAKTWPGL